MLRVNLIAIKSGYRVSEQYLNNFQFVYFIIININSITKLKNSRPHHMLQHAIRQNNFKMVEMICDAGADLNLFVEVKEYFRVSGLVFVF